MDGHGKDRRISDTDKQITLTRMQARQGGTPHITLYVEAGDDHPFIASFHERVLAL